jgi:hypothetical protein
MRDCINSPSPVMSVGIDRKRTGRRVYGARQASEWSVINNGE